MPTDWHPEDIKARIRKSGLSMSEVARRAGVPSHQLRHALITPREDGERVISEFLGIPPQRIWPSRYNKDGQRKRPQPRQNYSRVYLGSNPQ